MSFSAPLNIPQPGLICIAGNNNVPNVYVQPALTNLQGFPSNYTSAGNANVMVNTGATALTFVPGDTFALQLGPQAAKSLVGSATTQLLFNSTPIAGSMSYSNTHGDVTIGQTGWYLISATVGQTTVTAGNNFSIAISNGSGAITTTITTVDTDGVSEFWNLNCIAKLTLAQTIGVFCVNAGSTDTSVTAAGTQFSIKLIA